MKKRELWVDLLRGFAMFLVVMGHIYKSNWLYFMLSGPVKMPLFYILSGYVFKTDKKASSFLRHSALRLGIPWIIFSLAPLYLLKFALRRDAAGMLEYILQFISGNSNWFITSFFVTQCLVLITHKLLKEKEAFIWIASVILFAAGILTADIGVFNIWNVNTAFTGVLFMNMGYYIKQHIDIIDRFSNKIIIGGGTLFAGLMILSCIVYPGHAMDFHNVVYYNIPLCVLLCITGGLVLVCLTKKIRHNKLTNAVAIFGQNTIVVYLIHYHLVSVLRKCMGTGIFPTKNMPFPNAVFAAVLICILGTIISVICGEIVPWSVGKRTDKFINLQILRRNK